MYCEHSIEHPGLKGEVCPHDDIRPAIHPDDVLHSFRNCSSMTGNCNNSVDLYKGVLMRALSVVMLPGTSCMPSMFRSLSAELLAVSVATAGSC